MSKVYSVVSEEHRVWSFAHTLIKCLKDAGFEERLHIDQPGSGHIYEFTKGDQILALTMDPISLGNLKLSLSSEEVDPRQFVIYAIGEMAIEEIVVFIEPLLASEERERVEKDLSDHIRKGLASISFNSTS